MLLFVCRAVVAAAPISKVVNVTITLFARESGLKSLRLGVLITVLLL
jgi:hypothetical protein